MNILEHIGRKKLISIAIIGLASKVLGTAMIASQAQTVGIKFGLLMAASAVNSTCYLLVRWIGRREVYEEMGG
jgi:hypothetical protein